MREKIVGKIVKYIKYNKVITSEEEDKITYGLESIYILVTKLTIICIAGFILGIFKEMVIFLLIFNIIRTFSFGLHATKSWICLISSLTIFIGLPYLCILLSIPTIFKIIIGIILTIFIYKNSPADTKNRPIVNKKRRLRFKIISTIISILFTIISLFVNNYISNCLLISLLLENVLISPVTYKLFKLPYNNYIEYLKELNLEGDEKNVIC